MGSGKTTLARLLSAHRALPYYDLDIEIERKHGQSVAEIIFNSGEIFFRKLEREVLEEILQRPAFVLATGGGTPCYYNNMELINRQSVSVYLQCSVSELFDTLRNNRTERPLIAHLDESALKEFIAKHLFERNTFYKDAIFILPRQEKSVDETFLELEKLLQ